MTQKVKRALSLFMAAVLCCTALLGLGTTVYAAREQGTVYLIAFPRSGDENYSGAWGHDAAEYIIDRFQNLRARAEIFRQQHFSGTARLCLRLGRIGTVFFQKN